ncbi:hypothetical protein CLUG_05454 [Clavispora lusitaniae ATCC 42720]|uniref:Uncharacterized protein n=1 Tax=Clavispora lusitaniae (strain ATCC 42720) TaxID=306902 RepID=C4YAY9_CLAL4|nr:uncharacterized protein CLUG_05454 [Clavispora lusitaniae ATCC 42720]EEQ41326.1 hypothetical protein CLUG_05454 [Clavispora lusitaniae ATCC 42720]
MLQEVRSNGMEGVSDCSLSRVIDNEYHALSDDAALAKMGVFDLIQHCADLFEQVVKSRDSKEGLRLYVRAYLVFTYFITTYIMVHFQGFARFMERNHTDFVIYLNLYDFFHSTNVLGPEEFGADLHVVRCSVLGYLSSRDLLSFDTGDLFGWLNDYVAYYREKSDQEEESTHSQETSDYEAYYRALEDSDDESSLHGQDQSSTNESVPEYASVHSLSTHSVHTALPLKSDKSDAASNCASGAESDVESDFSAPISNSYSSHHSLSSLNPKFHIPSIHVYWVLQKLRQRVGFLQLKFPLLLRVYCLPHFRRICRHLFTHNHKNSRSM